MNATTAPSAAAVATGTASTGVSAASPPQTLKHDAAAPRHEPAAKPVVVPRCSSWFSMDKISPIEKRMLPEFFPKDSGAATTIKSTSSKTPQIYLKYRNYIINAYRQQPHVYLTATACRRNLAGDACAILRVHEFLTHWGLINYNVPPHAMPPAIHPNYALKPAVAEASTFPIPLTVAQAHTTSGQSLTGLWNCELCGIGAIEYELTPESRKKVAAQALNVAANGASSNVGATNKNATLVGFCTRPGSGICYDCYVSRCFPEGIDASEFVAVPKTARGEWTDEETQTLLSAIGDGGKEKESCDWNEIAVKVGTKTAEQCIVRFLQLPILDKLHQTEASSNSSVTGLPRPFAHAETANASLQEISQLVSQVDPFVAKAAARAAIGAVKQLHSMPASQTTEATEAIQTTEATTVAVKSEKVDAPKAEANGSSTDESVAMQDAAKAIADSVEAAGTAPAEPKPTNDEVKNEANTSANADVVMEDASGSPKKDASLEVTKEMLAVAREASNATAVSLLSARAFAIASSSTQESVRDLVSQLMQNQLQQMELKMQQLGVLERAIEAEREQLAKERYQLYLDRLAFAQEHLGGKQTS
ncbi:TPA: hypothetical protein N0F65_001595 [Lagenidium giganteum]|uniref:Uncharacterized protein n=1 Tax=Lagenidium giganteum TaxID=4803 RepID=A0AAV2Z4M2_9STRA|nr:TPA: hypothetical protein N0F65_001595 [Lagenidium giganteum]